MNVFVLCTGRCGSATFIEACRHITNYTAGHHSRSRLLGAERLNFPPRHIEADNRLSWFLGRLDRQFGDSTFYVHLKRDDRGVAESMVQRWGSGIQRAYATGIVMGKSAQHSPLEVCLDFCDTVNSNIEHFLKDKRRKMDFSLKTAKADFTRFWGRIEAQGDLDAALAEWDVRHNASDDSLVHRALRLVGAPARVKRSA